MKKSPAGLIMPLGIFLCPYFTLINPLLEGEIVLFGDFW
jgi:hypothetical protein